MKLEVMDYMNQRFETDVELENVGSLIVQVITGDEVVTVVAKDGTYQTIDASDLANDPRIVNRNDGIYAVHPEDFEAWMERKTTYKWIKPWESDSDDEV